MNSLLLATMLFVQAPVITTGNGTITGRIVSSDGVPAAGVRVTAMTPREPGQAEGVSVHSSITQTDGTGRYRLEDVPPGRYYITAGLLDAPTYYPGVSTLSTATVLIVADGVPNEGVDFQLKIPAGMKVSGRIVSPDSPPGTFSAQTVALNRAGVGVGVAAVSFGGGASFEAQTDANGAFEFLRVPPGNYTLRVLSARGMIEPTFVTVVDQEITNLEVRAPFQAELSGRIVLEDGSSWTQQRGIGIGVQGSNSAWGTIVQPNESFRFTLPEGEYQIALRAMPLGWVLRRISVGNNPLTSPIKIAPGIPALTNVVVTVSNVPLESIQGVRVSGQVLGVPPASRPGTSVVIIENAPGANMIEAAVNTDGTFEFPKVPSGNYTARVNGIANSSLPRPTPLVVGTDNISGFQIPVEVRTTVTGRATVVDASGNVLPGFPTGSRIWFYRGRFGGPYGNTRPDGTFGSSMGIVRPDGSFSMSLTEGEYVIYFDLLPPGYTVKSITSGSIDLLKNHLNVEKTVMPAAIQVQIEAKP